MGNNFCSRNMEKEIISSFYSEAREKYLENPYKVGRIRKTCALVTMVLGSVISNQESFNLGMSVYNAAINQGF